MATLKFWNFLQLDSIFIKHFNLYKQIVHFTQIPPSQLVQEAELDCIQISWCTRLITPPHDDDVVKMRPRRDKCPASRPIQPGRLLAFEEASEHACVIPFFNSQFAFDVH